MALQGRTGLRAFAFVAAAIGILGLLLTRATAPTATLGLVLAGACLVALLAVAWAAAGAGSSAGAPQAMVPDVEYAEPDMFPEDEDDAAVDPAPPPPPLPPPASRSAARGAQPSLPGSPAIDLESPLQRALAGLPPKPAPPSRYSQRMPVIPAEEEKVDEPVRRARRLVPSGQTLGEKREAARKARQEPAVEEDEEVEFTSVPAPPRTVPRPPVAQAVRPVVQPAHPSPPRAASRPPASVAAPLAQKAPLVVARKAGKGPVPADLARGKCSGCQTMLWATKARPVNLRCPECGKVTLLT
ncbi:MAG TPA: hypothetical protein VM286_06525 [Candidatus Thermoplasmatota archaeon]|nr:hypothetical protein [Candidatus Thermoplasmatota archaeon]